MAAEFRGPKNLHLGDSHSPWATAVWDEDAREYVITLEKPHADRFRPLAEEYGYREVQS
jgi:hypothetical protein